MSDRPGSRCGYFVVWKPAKVRRSANNPTTVTQICFMAGSSRFKVSEYEKSGRLGAGKCGYKFSRLLTL